MKYINLFKKKKTNLCFLYTIRKKPKRFWNYLNTYYVLGRNCIRFFPPVRRSKFFSFFFFIDLVKTKPITRVYALYNNGRQQENNKNFIFYSGGNQIQFGVCTAQDGRRKTVSLGTIYLQSIEKINRGKIE